MSSLTQVAISARKTIRYAIFFIIFLTVGRVLWGVGVSTYLKLFPPAPAAPTVKFGKLTKIPFPDNHNNIKLKFLLETATGSFPTDIPTQSKIYFMPKLSSNLLAKDVTVAKAQKMGFNDPNPEEKSDTVFKFKNPTAPSTLEANIVSGAFSISYDLVADRNPVLNRPYPAEVASTKFKGFLSEAGVLPEDLTGPMIPDYFKLQNGGLVRVLALSEANLTKVSLFRKPYDELPSVTANPRESNVWGLLSGANDRNQQIIAAEYHYFPIDESLFSTYPILTPGQAFDDLNNGKGFIATSGKYKDGENVKIRNVYLAYFDADTTSDYYQPVYVFESKETDPQDNFIGYVPAVTGEWYDGQ